MISLYETDAEGNEGQILMVQVNKFGDPTTNTAQAASVDFMKKISLRYANNELQKSDLKDYRDVQLRAIAAFHTIK